jgi:hypothetical protein
VSNLRYAISCLAALFAGVLPVVAQPGPNIAGNYRGKMTECLSTARVADCRKGLFELIALADEVDTTRSQWERSTAAGSDPGPLHESYRLAVERLNRAVTDFNRDMASPAVPSNQRP